MGEKTIIAWTDKSWNPWRGCTMVSPGCANCYMFREQRRYGKDPAVVVRTKTWGDPAKWQRKAAAEGRQERVFTCSWSDWFHVDADPWREEAWAVVRACPNLTFQILTKRADRIADHLPADWGAGYPNVWLGVSAEQQKQADERVPLLVKVPSTVRFVSYEPALGPVNFTPWLNQGGVNWLICGGESGPGYRPMDLDWARSVRDQCRETGTPFFFKQSSAPQTEMGIELDGEIVREYPK